MLNLTFSGYVPRVWSLFFREFVLVRGLVVCELYRDLHSGKTRLIVKLVVRLPRRVSCCGYAAKRFQVSDGKTPAHSKVLPTVSPLPLLIQASLGGLLLEFFL